MGVYRQDKQQQQEVAKELLAQCRWLEDNIDSNGPFLMGEQFSLVVSCRKRLCMQRHEEGFPIPCWRASSSAPHSDFKSAQSLPLFALLEHCPHRASKQEC